jgi:hypothetical protein
MPTGGFSDPGLDESELRARRALGLARSDAPKTRGWNGGGETGRRQGGPTHHKSRFVQDGEVPVVVVSNRANRPETSLSAAGSNERSRLADAESALRRERTAREQAERELATAQNQIRDLQTRLAHAELARDEAQAAERAAMERLEAMAKAPGEPEPAAADEAPAAPRARRGRPPKTAEAATAAAPRRGRPPKAAGTEDDQEVTSLPTDKPVKWWLPPGVDEDDDQDADW